MAGQAILHRRQDEPPWILLSEAQTALSAMDRIGPPATSEALKQISNYLLPSGVRQTTVNGAHISWTHSSPQGEQAFRKALLGPDGPVPGLLRQISDALGNRIARKKLLTFDHDPSPEEVETLGLIELPDQEDAQWLDKWRCYAIGREWSEFRTACLDLSMELGVLLKLALREGRVLIVEELFPGGRLLHPDRWKDEEYDPANYVNDWVLLTRDLPNDWFAKRPNKLGRPKGRGGYAEKDAPFVDLILRKLDDDSSATVHGAVTVVIDQYGHEIPGASYEAKVRRLMERVSARRG